MKKKILKRVVSLLLGALLLAGCALPAGAASPFTDVTPGTPQPWSTSGKGIG